MTQYLLAHDLGTSGDKATLFTTDGEMIQSETASYKTLYPQDNWAEQNPEDWWVAICEATRALIKNIDPGSIEAVSFSGQMMGCLCVDQKGNPLRNSIIYCDSRGVQEAETLLKTIEPEDFYQIVGHRISAVYSLEKLLWVKHNQPEIYKNTYKMLNAKDYIVYKLTGEFVTDQSDASGTNAYDLEKGDWSDRILEMAEIERNKLPEIHPSIDVVGTITKEAEKETGLKFGTPVVIGAGDGSACVVGVGCIKPGSAYTYLGSSAWMGTTTTQPLLDEKMRTMTWAHAIPGLYHATGSMQTAGTCFQWLKDEICKWETEKAEGSTKGPFDLINAEITQSVPGSNGIIFLPYLMGERSPHWNPNAKGAFIGIKLTSKRADILRSVLEGVTFNLKLILDIFKSKISVDQMGLVGGGARSEVWTQIMADIYELELSIPNYLEEATSIGAAIIGGVGVGALKGFSDVERFIRVVRSVPPIQGNQDAYQKAAKRFVDTYNTLVDVFEEY
jgi:xylulokinase